MSAYGVVQRPKATGDLLLPRIYPLSSRPRTPLATSQDADTKDNGNNPPVAILCLPFGPGSSLSSTIPTGAKERMWVEFNEELQRGLTYPQRDQMTSEQFEAYFLGYDVIVGVFLRSLPSGLSLASLPQAGTSLTSAKEALAVLSVSELSQIDFREDLAYFYYIKPNYPGRSSHLCNAGFVVPASNRGMGLGSVAGQSFLSYGPALGYKGSVFNLVYDTNIASLAIWQRLGFTTVGKIPKAGLMRRKPGIVAAAAATATAEAGSDGTEEEYVDAWIIYCDFEENAKRF